MTQIWRNGPSPLLHVEEKVQREATPGRALCSLREKDGIEYAAGASVSSTWPFQTRPGRGKLSLWPETDTSLG